MSDQQQIQLTIRCALETFSDYNVECSPDWTILQLKEHLAQICAFKPDVARQRLIYSGRCLENGQKISEVLKLQRDGIQRPVEELLEKQVIHMVYIGDSPPKSGEGIRHRANAANPSNSNNQNPPNPMEQNYGQPPPMIAAPNYGIQHQSHEAWMAAYHNYMAQMMQFYQHGGMPAAMPYVQYGAAPWIPAQQIPFTNQAQFIGVHPAAFGGPQNAQQIAQAAAGPIAAVPNPNNDLLNARAAAAAPDFLDLIYKSIRFALLAMILYLYSSLERFVFVVSIVGLFWFVRARRDQQGRQQQQNPQNAGGGNMAAADEQQQRGAQEVDPNQQQPPNMQQTAAPQVQPNAASNAWNIFFQTIHSFFTSLVPEPAPPLEIN